MYSYTHLMINDSLYLHVLDLAIKLHLYPSYSNVPLKSKTLSPHTNNRQQSDLG